MPVFKTKNEAEILAYASLSLKPAWFLINQEPYPANLTTKVIQHDVLRFDTIILQHFDHCRVHHWRSAHVELAIFRCWMVFQILFKQYVVDEAGITLEDTPKGTVWKRKR